MPFHGSNTSWQWMLHLPSFTTALPVALLCCVLLLSGTLPCHCEPALLLLTTPLLRDPAGFVDLSLHRLSALSDDTPVERPSTAALFSIDAATQYQWTTSRTMSPAGTFVFLHGNSLSVSTSAMQFVVVDSSQSSRRALQLGNMALLPSLGNEPAGYPAISIDLAEVVYVPQVDSWYGVAFNNEIYGDNNDWFLYYQVYANVTDFDDRGQWRVPMINSTVHLQAGPDGPVAAGVSSVVDPLHSRLISRVAFGYTGAPTSRPNWLLSIDLTSDTIVSNVTYPATKDAAFVDALLTYSTKRSVLYSAIIECLPPIPEGNFSLSRLEVVDPATGKAKVVFSNLSAPSLPGGDIYNTFDDESGNWYFMGQTDSGIAVWFAVNIDSGAVSALMTTDLTNQEVLALYVQELTADVSDSEKRYQVDEHTDAGCAQDASNVRHSSQL